MPFPYRMWQSRLAIGFEYFSGFSKEHGSKPIDLQKIVQVGGVTCGRKPAETAAAVIRYRSDKNLEAQPTGKRNPNCKRFFADLEECCTGEDIHLLQQKQAEYLALQNQYDLDFLYNALEAIRLCSRIRKRLPKRPRRLPLFFAIRFPGAGVCDVFR